MIRRPTGARVAFWLMSAGVGGLLAARLARSGRRAAQAVRLALAGTAVFLAYRGMRATFADLKLADTFGTAWMPYSDALGPWFGGGLSFLFGLAPPDYLYRPTIGIFWASLLALGQHTQFIAFFFCGWLLAFLAVVLSTGRDEAARLALVIGLGAYAISFSQMWHTLFVSSIMVDFPSLVLTLTGVVLVFRERDDSARASLLAGCLCLGVAAAIRGPMLVAGPLMIAVRLRLVERAGLRTIAASAGFFALPVVVDAMLQRHFGVVNNGLPALFCMYSDPWHTWTAACHTVYLTRKPTGWEVLAAALSFLASQEARAWLFESIRKRVDTDFRLLASLPSIAAILFTGIASAGAGTWATTIWRTLAVAVVLVVAGEMEWKFVAFAAIAMGIAAAVALHSWRAFACFGGYLAGTLLLAIMGLAHLDRLQHTFSFTLFLAFAFLIVDAPARLEARAGGAEWALPAMVAATVAFLYFGFLLPNEWRDIYLLEVHPHQGRALKVADDPRIDRSLYYTGQRQFVYTRHDELPVGAVRKYRALRVPQSYDNDGFVSPNTFVD